MSDERAVPGELGVIEALDLNLSDLRARFAQAGMDPSTRRIRNPHVEGAVSEATIASATPSSVLVVITDELTPRVLLTRRQQGIRFPGHMCFPGGRAEPNEPSLQTALRESEEEIGLAPAAVDLLGSFGHYFTQAGYRMDTFVGVVAPDYEYQPDVSEVASLHFFPLRDVLDPACYELRKFNQERAYFAFDQQGVHVGGPTVSVMIGLLEFLAD